MVPRSVAMASTHVRHASAGGAADVSLGRLKKANIRAAPSDSDCSGETASLSNESIGKPKASVQPVVVPQKRSNSRRKGSEWEVLEGLKDGQRFERKPEVFNGYLHKKRKWPLKGWHKLLQQPIPPCLTNLEGEKEQMYRYMLHPKSLPFPSSMRYFVVDGGILVYARGPSDVARGRLHGSVDVGLSVVSAKQRRRRIDIDADDTIYHLRAKTHDVFAAWVHVLKAHRLYRQHLLTFGVREMGPRLNILHENSVDKSSPPTLLSPRAPSAGFVTGTPGGRLASWSLESNLSLDVISKMLGQAQLSIQELQRLAEVLETQPHDIEVSLENTPSVKKDRRKFGLRKKKSTNKCGSVDLSVPHALDIGAAQNVMSINTAPPSPGATSLPPPQTTLPVAMSTSRPASLPSSESTNCGPASMASTTGENRLRDDFNVLAKDLVSSLKTVLSALLSERNRLHRSDSNGTSLNVLRDSLNSALMQNEEMKSRLAKIHDTSDLGDTVYSSADQVTRQLRASLSYSSSCLSQSEFFDAQDTESDHNPTTILPADVEAGVIELEGDTSSEAGSLSSEEGSASSDNSDLPIHDADAASVHSNALSYRRDTPLAWARRSRLASPRPDRASPSLWHLLCKNIGKDLSQISMPVTINEPLNMLQRLCEELEYSALLDAAASCSDATQRLCLIAAFAVSAYASSAHRAASKPFNPLLGETYEADRPDRGFKFIAEQVSHHPPISACHAESSKWVFWQEARIKTKFWGKSMEFQPAGKVHVKLLTTGDHYTWNKVTTCVHNLYAGQRWVDQYGDMQIKSHNDNASCKLTFVKANGWFSSRNEVRGSTVGTTPNVKLSGRWSEVLLSGDPPNAKCLWQSGPMPQDFEIYYGFTRFAMELNEMEPGMPECLPSTDTRLRPDQRALEEGDIDRAENFKGELEQAQRERRRTHPQPTPLWFRKSMEPEGEEVWVSNGEYWKARENGFQGIEFLPLW